MLSVDNIIEYEQNGLSLEEEVIFFQKGIDSGDVWRLQGSYGRRAMDLINAGYCMLGLVGHKDYWGNYIPSRFEVKQGTKGSKLFVSKMTKKRENE